MGLSCPISSVNNCCKRSKCEVSTLPPCPFAPLHPHGPIFLFHLLAALRTSGYAWPNIAFQYSKFYHFANREIVQCFGEVQNEIRHINASVLVEREAKFVKPHDLEIDFPNWQLRNSITYG